MSLNNKGDFGTKVCIIEEDKNQSSNKKKFDFKAFWSWIINNLAKTTNGMAIGLFGTLIIGTIFSQIALIPGLKEIEAWAKVIKSLMGAGIGLGVALSLKRNGVMVVAAMASGVIGTYVFDWFGNLGKDSLFTVVSTNDPLSAYFASIFCLLAIKLVMRKKTPVDLILIPLVGILFAMIYSTLFGYFIHYITIGIGKLVEISFEAIPWIMAILVSILVGMALTAPISSVAICVAIQIGAVDGSTASIAAGAALIGCCTQMVGFAVETAYDNKWGSVLAVGIGTSMLQFKNIVKKPIIWLPTIIASGILGVFAYVFKIMTDSVGAGMGTSGLIGPLNTFASMNYDWKSILIVLAFTVVTPAILVFLIDLLFRKIGWIKKGDFALKNEL